MASGTQPVALVTGAHRGIGAAARSTSRPGAGSERSRVNTRAPIFLTQALAGRMVAAEAPRRGPRGIAFVTSVHATLASPDRADYSASKAALSTVALRFAEDRIPVQEVRPGVIRTAMTKPVAERYGQRIGDGLSPIRRWGEPGDVAWAIAGLFSGAIPSSTGDALHVDGGLHIGRF